MNKHFAFYEALSYDLPPVFSKSLSVSLHFTGKDVMAQAVGVAQRRTEKDGEVGGSGVGLNPVFLAPPPPTLSQGSAGTLREWLHSPGSGMHSDIRSSFSLH